MFLFDPSPPRNLRDADTGPSTLEPVRNEVCWRSMTRSWLICLP